MADSRGETVSGCLRLWIGPARTAADDRTLLERFVRQRDEAAFAELVARHGRLVYSLCCRLLGNVQDAEDVFQATFFVLARKAATIRKPQSLSCWLHGVASRLAFKANAEGKRRRSHEQRAAPISESAEPDLSWREVRGLLDEELQRLPEKQRLPLVLCYLEGLTQDEAARQLGWPRGTLKRRLEAGRERLRIRLTRRGVTLGAGLFAVALSESGCRAAVPLALRSATVRATLQFLSHETAAVSAAPAALLARGALQSMLTAKLKLGALLVLLLGCAVTAAGLAIQQTPPEKQLETKVEVLAPTVPATTNKGGKDRRGDALPQGAIARLGTVRLRHPDGIGAFLFTPDGKTAIVGDDSGHVLFWDVATGQKICEWERLPLGRPLALTADGKRLARPAWGGGVDLCDVETGKLISHYPIKPINWGLNQLLFTPDGKMLIFRDFSRIIQIWDVDGKKKAHELKSTTTEFSCMAFSPDGRTLATGCTGRDPFVRLWNVATGRRKDLFKVSADDFGLMDLAYSPDGKSIAATDMTGKTALFDAATGKCRGKIEDCSGLLQSLTFSPDGKMLMGVENGTAVHLFDAASGKSLRRFGSLVRCIAGPRLACSPDGKTLAAFGGGSHGVEFWDVPSGKRLHPDGGPWHGVTSLEFSADAQTVFASTGMWDEGWYSWDARTGQARDHFPANGYGAGGLALSPDGRLLAVAIVAEGHPRGAPSSVPEKYTILLWDIARRKAVRSLKGHTGAVEAIDWSADGKTLVSISYYDKTIRIWNAATGVQRLAIESRQDSLGRVALSPDGAMVAASGYNGGVIRLWDAATGKELRSLPKLVPNLQMYSVAFSPDGSALACAGAGGSIYLLEPKTGRVLRRLETKDLWIAQVFFSPDGRTLASAHSDGSIHLWETTTAKERACFTGHRGPVRSVAFSRDARRIASGGADTSILVWDTTAGTRSDAILSAEQLRASWRDLNDADAGRAYRAVWRMALAPKQALPFLAERVRPVAPLDAKQQKRVEQLLVDLDSDRFAVRQKAEADLEKMGSLIEPVLRKTLECKPPLEVRQRIEAVLARFTNERLRLSRALEAIEHMSTPEARRLMHTLAGGTPHAWLTEEAQAIRKRLAKQAVTVPER